MSATGHKTDQENNILLKLLQMLKARMLERALQNNENALYAVSEATLLDTAGIKLKATIIINQADPKCLVCKYKMMQ